MRNTDVREKFMRCALRESQKALQKAEVPIGCVIVKNGKIISRGHNLRETKQNSLLHAEIVAIDKACKKLKNFRLEECEMYVTIEPCIMCAGAIIQSRIKKVYFGARDLKYGAVVSTSKAFEMKSNHKVEFEEGILEEESSTIVKEFFKDLRKNNQIEKEKMRVNNQPIAFFDSGIGGSTILKEVMQILPNERYIYYPDSSHNPYGNKSEEELFEIVDNVIKKLLPYNPKLIVCACNTATAMVLNKIRVKYPELTFVGTEPAIKVIANNYSDKKSIVLTTKGTGDSERFQELFNKYKTENCKLIEAPYLAGFIERGEKTDKYLKELLKAERGTEVVVLGCTHFPLVKREITDILGSVIFVDGSKGVAKRVRELLETKIGIGNCIGNVEIIADDKIKKRINTILK